MGIQYQQTDTFASCPPAQHCSPAGMPGDLPIFTSLCPAAPATAGSTDRTVSNGTKVEVSALFFQIEPDWTNINAVIGDWTVRFHVTQIPEVNLKWVRTCLCHIKKTGCVSQAALGSALKNQNIVFGVNTHTVPGVTIPASRTADDAIYIIITLRKFGGFSLVHRAGQRIDSPYTPAGGSVLDYERKTRGVGRGVARGVS